ncbi:MAG: phage tail terminator family protein [Peptococcaceae bacterium]
MNRLLVEKYPDYPVYVELCPEDFEGPGFLLELVTTSQNPVNCKTFQETEYFTITCFAETINLLAIQQGVLEIFGNGYILVDDRAIEVKAGSGGRDFDQAYIDLQVEYYEERSNAPHEIPPLMKEVYIKVKEE